MSRTLLAMFGILCGGLWSSVFLAAAHARSSPSKPMSVVTYRDLFAGGVHWRMLTPNGAVHVWRPATYQPESAGTVLFVHGYYTNVDDAWEQHQLPEQFRLSRRNALFIAVEAPEGNADPVRWPQLDNLLQTVTQFTDQEIPGGPLVAVGHSGAIRTLLAWIPDRRLDQILLLDALYTGEGELDLWLSAAPPGKRHQLVLVGFETVERTESFLLSLDLAMAWEFIPESVLDFRPEDRSAQTLYFRSQYGHMEMITEGKVIPLLLRLTSLAPL